MTLEEGHIGAVETVRPALLLQFRGHSTACGRTTKRLDIEDMLTDSMRLQGWQINRFDQKERISFKHSDWPGGGGRLEKRTYR